MPDVHVLAERLAEVGWRYTVPADQGRQVTVVAEEHGPAHLVITDPRLDEPLTTVRLSASHASVLAALMTGARFTLETPDAVRATTATDPADVVVETVTVSRGSPALGRTPVNVVRPSGAVLSASSVTQPRSWARPTCAAVSRPVTSSSWQPAAGG